MTATETRDRQFEPLMDFDERVAQIRERYAGSARLARQVAIFDRACACVDRSAVTALQGKYSARASGDLSSSTPLKYLDLPYYIWHKAHMIERLDLDQSEPKSILDIGMGAGHFGLMCKAFGHRPYGLDLADRLYGDICAAFGLHRVTEAVEKFKPLPDFGTKFDVVTAFSLMFHIDGHGDDRTYWWRDEWDWFLQDVSSHLKPQGTVVLVINPKRLPGGKIELQHDLTELFARNGAEIVIPGRDVLWRVRDEAGIRLATA